MANISKIKSKATGQVFDLADAVAREALKDGVGGKIFTVNTFNNLPNTKEDGMVEGQLAWVLSDRIASEPDEEGYVTYTYTGYKAGLYAYNEAKGTWLQISKNEYVQLYFVKKDEEADEYVVTKVMNIPVNFGYSRGRDQYSNNNYHDKQKYSYDSYAPGYLNTVEDIDNSYANRTDLYLIDIGIHGNSFKGASFGTTTEVLVPIASLGSAKAFDFDSLKVGSRIKNNNYFEANYGSYIYNECLYYPSDMGFYNSHGDHTMLDMTYSYSRLNSPLSYYNKSKVEGDTFDGTGDFISFDGSIPANYYGDRKAIIENGQLGFRYIQAKGSISKNLLKKDEIIVKAHILQDGESTSSYTINDDDQVLPLTSDEYGYLISDTSSIAGNFVLYVSNAKYYTTIDSSSNRLRVSSYWLSFNDDDKLYQDCNGWIHTILEDDAGEYIIGCGNYVRLYKYNKFIQNGNEYSPYINEYYGYNIDSGYKIYISKDNILEGNYAYTLKDNINTLPTYGRPTVHTSLILEDSCIFAGNCC